MYFDEQVINGVLCYRHNPNAKWIPYTLEQMARRWEEMQREIQNLRNPSYSDGF